MEPYDPRKMAKIEGLLPKSAFFYRTNIEQCLAAAMTNMTPSERPIERAICVVFISV